MIDIDPIARQILYNCDVSDSEFAGYFSVCGLALRLRDLYKWEHRLDPWIEKDSTEILDWIGDRETRWEKLSEEGFKNLKILDTLFDPFDTGSINLLLEPAGIIYGAGYARGLKPTFFLAELKEKRTVNSHAIYILGREYARDLLTTPALSRDRVIMVRKESMRYYLWDKIFFIRKSARPALDNALSHYGIKSDQTRAVGENLDRIVDEEIDTFIHHELGEAYDTVFDRDLWREIVSTFAHTPVELLTRGVKDLLADTSADGTLHHIITEKKKASLALYVAFLDGLLKELFSELPEAFEEFMETDDWAAIEAAVASGFREAKQYARTISSTYLDGKQAKGKEWTEKELEKQLLVPLGIYRP